MVMFRVLTFLTGVAFIVCLFYGASSLFLSIFSLQAEQLTRAGDNLAYRFAWFCLVFTPVTAFALTIIKYTKNKLKDSYLLR